MVFNNAESIAFNCVAACAAGVPVLDIAAIAAPTSLNSKPTADAVGNTCPITDANSLLSNLPSRTAAVKISVAPLADKFSLPYAFIADVAKSAIAFVSPNPDALAFNEAFNQDDDVELWMMCDNPFYSEEENFKWERLYRSSALGDKVRVVPRQPSQQDVYNVMSQADCGVFPARAEGWNLELLEMMSCGKQVIATNYASHTEFCNEDNCMLVNTDDLEDAHDGKWFRGQGKWASIKEEQITQIAEHMRAVHEKKKKDELNINQAGVDTAKQFSWLNSAKKIIEAIEK